MAVLSYSSEHEAGAVIVENGKLIAAVNEERFTRVKNQSGFPKHSIEAVLKISGLKPEDIKHVIIPEMSKAKDLLTNVVPLYPLNVFSKNGAPYPGLVDFIKQFLMSFYIIIKSYLRVGFSHYQDIRKLKKMFRKAEFHRVEHHVTHAASAFFTCTFDEALIISADYWGDFASVMVSIGKGKDIKVVSRSYYPHSPGHYYASITKWFGFKANRHEGKIVGLAAYGDHNSPAYEKVKDLLVCDGFKIKAPFMMGKLWHHKIPIFKNNLMRQLLDQYSREDVAAVLQRRFEEVFVELVTNCVKKYKIENLLLVGGSFANVKLNQRVFEVDGIKNVYVFPNMSDGGIPSGAALYFDIRRNGAVKSNLNNVYLGPDYSDEDIRQALVAENVPFEYYEDIETKIAQLLADNSIVARFNGRMEYGPRALGNRSILYPATDPTVNDWLNKRLKRTEFMPFAPVTLAEHADKCYKNIHGAEYTAGFMTITFDCTDFMKEKSPATVHVDGTARPQLISEHQNPSYYKILNEYHKLTGIPSIVNTSFNMHEEPIVCSPRDAIRSFKQGHLQYLAIGKYLVKSDDMENSN
ncbi:carbamoyltransferase [candidate division KSB1 bacterium]|nr:carbamoyltransferase [candidate division KSB1 bacterium]